jgi:hypothetical protein
MITVVSQEEDYATVSSFRKLAIGARVQFESSFGIITQTYNDTTYGVKLSNSSSVSVGKVLTWWKLAQPSFTILVPQLFFVGSEESKFCAQCITSRQGGIRWQLFYGSRLILTGNDELNPGYCKAQVRGSFPEGTYRLRVTQYLNQSPIKQVEKCWTVPSPTSTLECKMGAAISAINLA